DRDFQRTDKIHVEGSIRIRGRRLVDTQLVLRTKLGEHVFDADTVGDDFRQFRLSPRFGFCGFVEYYLRRQFLSGRSAVDSWGVAPELESFIPETVAPGANLVLVGNGFAGCE